MVMLGSGNIYFGVPPKSPGPRKRCQSMRRRARELGNHKVAFERSRWQFVGKVKNFQVSLE